jgi:class 3 adenylate cyclase/tetratricopeptide (TPR) repeat protein
MNCPNCITANPLEAKFCLNCGAPLPLTCPVCGVPALPTAKFCSQCGSSLESRALAPDLDAATAGAVNRAPSINLPSQAPFTLEAQNYERRQVTILFADVIGFSSLSEQMDPEDVVEIMRGAYPCLMNPIHHYMGTIIQVMGDGLLAFFGAPLAAEDDPERAVRAGLEIQGCVEGYADELLRERGILGFKVRVGIHTGLVVVGEMSPEQHLEYTALGDTVNLAARLEQNAPHGAVLISHETYRQVRGLFNVQPQAPMEIKGRRQPVQAYVVHSAKPQGWRIRTRGVEGVDTRMIGREPEMLALQNIYHDSIHAGEAALVLITGEAGLGKSRLLDEMIARIDLQDPDVWMFHGRAASATQNSPYAIFRDLFAQRFDIKESDNAAQALDCFRQGMSAYLEPDQADLVGQWVGFDFSLSPAVKRLAGGPALARLAALYMTHFFRQLANRPLLIFLEDLHWADDSSLDLITQLLAEIRSGGPAHLMFACAARPTLFERRPNWGEGTQGFTRLILLPLSRQFSRGLVEEIFKKAETVPAALVERIIDETEGSPFFIEELVKMLIEDGVIQTSNETWTIDPTRMNEPHVPPTLAGILQARLDSLPPAERQVLQRAAVVGRVFWDRLVGLLTDDPEEAAQVSNRLAALRERELIYRRERSSITGAEEYLFKHSLLQEAAYETVLLRQRRTYHARVAGWIEDNAGERLEEYLALIASHHVHAGQVTLAADWYTRAGERAASLGAPREACELFSTALELIPPDDRPRRWRTLLGRSAVLIILGEREARQADDAALLALAEETGDDEHLAEAYGRIGYYNYTLGNMTRSLENYNLALEAAKKSNSIALQATLLPLKLVVLSRLGDLQSAAALAEPALELAEATGNPVNLMRALTNVSIYYATIGDLARSTQLVQRQVEINQEQGNRISEAFGLSNLGYNYLLLGRYEHGRRVLERALEASRSVGARAPAAYNLLNLGLACWRLGDLQAARQAMNDSLPELQAIGDEIGLAYRQYYSGLIQEATGDLAGAGQCYLAAQADFARLEMLPLKIEAQAGLARLCLQRGQILEAESHATEVFSHLDQHGPQGQELPMLVYLTCVEVFSASNNQEQAERALENGRAELDGRAKEISDLAWRKTFLEAAPEHHKFIQIN